MFSKDYMVYVELNILGTNDLTFGGIQSYTYKETEKQQNLEYIIIIPVSLVIHDLRGGCVHTHIHT